jgi:hypothetical protein
MRKDSLDRYRKRPRVRGESSPHHPSKHGTDDEDVPSPNADGDG